MVEVRALQPLNPALDAHLTVASVGALPLASPPSNPAGPVSSPAPVVAPLTSQPVSTAAAALPVILPAPVTSAPVRTLFVQAGAFAAPDNAQRLADKLRAAG